MRTTSWSTGRKQLLFSAHEVCLFSRLSRLYAYARYVPLGARAGYGAWRHGRACSAARRDALAAPLSAKETAEATKPRALPPRTARGKEG